MTRRYIPIGILFLLFVFQSCDNYDILEDYPPIGESEHFIIGSQDESITEQEMQSLLADLELAHDLISDFFGQDNISNEEFTVVLKGDFDPDYGVGGLVDEFGFIHLYRMSEKEGGYTAHTDHELVHAFRFPELVPNDKILWENMGFLEEGIAEYLSILFFNEKESFSTYSLPLSVVARYWIQGKPDLSLEALRNRHQEMNKTCAHQVYPLRASWVEYIRQEFGKEKLLKLVFPKSPPNNDFVQELFGKTYAGLDKDWKNWVLEESSNHSNLDSLLSNYETFIAEYTPCDW